MHLGPTAASKRVRFLTELVTIPASASTAWDKGIAKIERNLREPWQLTSNIAIISAVAFCYLLKSKRKNVVIASITTLDEIDRVLKAKLTIA